MQIPEKMRFITIDISNEKEKKYMKLSENRGYLVVKSNALILYAKEFQMPSHTEFFLFVR